MCTCLLSKVVAAPATCTSLCSATFVGNSVCSVFLSAGKHCRHCFIPTHHCVCMYVCVCVCVCVCPDSLLSDLYRVIDECDALINTQRGHLSPPSPPALYFLTLSLSHSLISSQSLLHLLDLPPLLSFNLSVSSSSITPPVFSVLSGILLFL